MNDLFQSLPDAGYLTVFFTPNVLSVGDYSDCVYEIRPHTWLYIIHNFPPTTTTLSTYRTTTADVCGLEQGFKHSNLDYEV